MPQHTTNSSDHPTSTRIIKSYVVSENLTELCTFTKLLSKFLNPTLKQRFYNFPFYLARQSQFLCLPLDGSVSILWRSLTNQFTRPRNVKKQNIEFLNFLIGMEETPLKGCIKNSDALDQTDSIIQFFLSCSQNVSITQFFLVFPKCFHFHQLIASIFTRNIQASPPFFFSCQTSLFQYGNLQLTRKNKQFPKSQIKA